MRHGVVPRPRDRAAQLRAEFDASFARTPVVTGGDREDVLSLRIGDEPFALRLDGVAQVVQRPVLTSVPSRAPALRAIASGNGQLVVAYDLGLLLGRAATAPRWLLVAAADTGVGVTFEHLDGHRRIAPGTSGTARVLTMADLVEAVHHLGAPDRDGGRQDDGAMTR